MLAVTLLLLRSAKHSFAVELLSLEKRRKIDASLSVVVRWSDGSLQTSLTISFNQNMSEGNNSQQSARSLLARELMLHCQSELLSEDGIRELIDRHGLTHNNHHLSNYEFFHAVCKNERVTEGIIQYLLEYFPDAASAITWHGLEPLYCACNNKNVTLGIIQLLIDADPDSISSRDSEGSTPLHRLCRNSEMDEMAAIEILRLLIEKYPAAVRHPDNRGRLPIYLASRRGRSPEFCRLLIEEYPGSERMTKRNSAMPLHWACENNALATVEYLHRHYPDAINRKTKGGHYPIHIAILGFAVEIVQYLLDCDPNQKLLQFQGASLLHFACGQQYTSSSIEAGIQMINVIFDAHPESVRSVNNEGSMPLHFLCNNGKVDKASAMRILMFLLEKHPDAVQHPDSKGRLPIQLASMLKSREFCSVLIEAYPGSERITTTSGLLPLHFACSRGSLTTVEYLYRQYPDAIHNAVQGHYPIHIAINCTKDRESPAAAVEIVRFLLDCDPDQKLIRFEGRSLLQYACGMRYNDSHIETGIQLIKLIFDARPEAIEDNRISTVIQHYHQQVQAFIKGELVYARQATDQRLISTPDYNGQLPLHTSLQSNVRLGSIKLLVKGNRDAAQSPDNIGALPLHIACQHHNSVSVVQYLVEHDTTSLDALDREGNSALHYACRGAKYETIALLLEKYNTASLSKTNVYGKLPIDLLWESNAVKDRECVEFTDSFFRLLRAYPEMIQSVI